MFTFTSAKGINPLQIAEIMNTTFTILKTNADGEMEVVFSEIRRTKTIPFSLKSWFVGHVGEETKFTMWTEGDEDVTVLGRGGKMNAKFS